MDPFGSLQTYNLSMPVDATENMIDQFGVPRWLFDAYEDTEYNRELRLKEMEKGLFELTDNTIVVDKSAVIDFYGASFCKPIAELIVSSLSDYGLDNRMNRIEYAMRFVQDIPYGVPKYEDKFRHFGGVNIIPKLLIDGYGDCDSKVFLFAGIMVYLIPADEFIFLNQQSHVLSAIEGEPETGQTYIRYSGKKYLLAETAGPGHRKLGEEGKYYRNNFTTERLKIEAPDIIPYGDNSNQARAIQAGSRAWANAVSLKNESARVFKFEVSYDKINWEPMSIPANQTGNINFDNGGQKYLRYRLKGSSYEVLEVMTGMEYTLEWNDRKDKWNFTQL
jgi:hypothetical protein